MSRSSVQYLKASGAGILRYPPRSFLLKNSSPKGLRQGGVGGEVGEVIEGQDLGNAVFFDIVGDGTLEEAQVDQMGLGVVVHHELGKAVGVGISAGVAVTVVLLAFFLSVPQAVRPSSSTRDRNRLTIRFMGKAPLNFVFRKGPAGAVFPFHTYND